MLVFASQTQLESARLNYLTGENATEFVIPVEFDTSATELVLAPYDPIHL